MLYLLAVLSSCIYLCQGVSWTLPAFEEPRAANERFCLSQFIGKGQLVSGTANSTKEEEQILGIEVRDDSTPPNIYYKKNEIGPEGSRFAFSAHNHDLIHFCFTNSLRQGIDPRQRQYYREVVLHVTTGADAQKFADGQNKDEKLKPMEGYLKRIESVVNEVYEEMEFLKKKEMEMRDINESTNGRVQGFSLLSILVLVGLGLWQIFYLKKFFQSKKLI